MKTKPNKHTDAAIALQAGDRAGAQTAAQATACNNCRTPRFFASALTAVTLALASAGTALAQSLSWDNTRTGNPYVAAGYGDQCTAFSFGRYKTVNGEALRFLDTKGKAVYPNAGLMYDYVVETSTSYRDTTPVRGALISWKKSGEPGHTGTAERIYSDGSADIGEQNWPTGSGPSSKKLTASQLQSRSSTVNGKTSYYTQAGYVCPNRPTSLGTLYTAKIDSNLQLDVAVLDEDNRNVNVLVALLDGSTVVSNTTASGSIAPNRAVQVVWKSPKLTRGKKYSVWFQATDWRGLKASKSATFTW